MIFDQLTLVTCSYDTPHITMTMLRSWKEINGHISNKLYIVDNSVSEDTAELLHNEDIIYVRNPGGTHYQGVQLALDNVQTKYILLVDTDVIFNKDISPILKIMEERDITILGEVCGDRGGQSLYPRIHPWFCLINVSHIKSRQIRFINEQKILNTGSGQYYSNMPVGPTNRNIRKYDVGATFLEDIIKSQLKAYNIKLDPEYYFHYEGMSWRGRCGIPGLVEANNSNEELYKSDFEKYKNIDICGWYL